MIFVQLQISWNFIKTKINKKNIGMCFTMVVLFVIALYVKFVTAIKNWLSWEKALNLCTVRWNWYPNCIHHFLSMFLLERANLFGPLGLLRDHCSKMTRVDTIGTMLIYRDDGYCWTIVIWVNFPFPLISLLGGFMCGHSLREGGKDTNLYVFNNINLVISSFGC